MGLLPPHSAHRPSFHKLDDNPVLPPPLSRVISAHPGQKATDLSKNHAIADYRCLGHYAWQGPAGEQEYPSRRVSGRPPSTIFAAKNKGRCTRWDSAIHAAA
jgi:hypothetical protein